MLLLFSFCRLHVSLCVACKAVSDTRRAIASRRCLCRHGRPPPPRCRLPRSDEHTALARTAVCQPLSRQTDSCLSEFSFSISYFPLLFSAPREASLHFLMSIFCFLSVAFSLHRLRYFEEFFFCFYAHMFLRQVFHEFLFFFQIFLLSSFRFSSFLSHFFCLMNIFHFIFLLLIIYSLLSIFSCFLSWDFIEFSSSHAFISHFLIEEVSDFQYYKAQSCLHCYVSFQFLTFQKVFMSFIIEKESLLVFLFQNSQLLPLLPHTDCFRGCFFSASASRFDYHCISRDYSSLHVSLLSSDISSASELSSSLQLRRRFDIFWLSAFSLRCQPARSARRARCSGWSALALLRYFLHLLWVFCSAVRFSSSFLLFTPALQDCLSVRSM